MKRNDYDRIGETCYCAELSNGLTVRVVPKRGFARKKAFLAVNFGAVDTSFTLDGTPYRVPDGIAHYLEHKMFEQPDGDAMAAFARTDGFPNAFTSYAMTAYHFLCTEHFEENLRLLLEMVTTPYFTDENVEKERGIITQEIGMYEDDPHSRAGELLFGALFAEHPVRVPILGTVESIGRITPELLYLCHRAFYRPENMMLCVVGDVDPESVCRIAEETVKPLPPVTLVRDYGKPTDLRPAAAKTQREMSISMPTFTLGYRCPPPRADEDILRREIVAELASELLAGESSPFYRRLYEAGLIDSSFGIGYESVGTACAFVADGDSDDPQAVTDELTREIARVQREGFETARFERLKRSAVGRRTRDLDSFESICYRICAYFFEGVDYFEFPRRYAEITQRETADFLREMLRPERASLAVILPKEENNDAS